MQLEVEYEGQKIPVTVTEEGKFTATVGDVVVEDERFWTVQHKIKDTIIGSRVNEPFVSVTGRRGVLRGFHAGNRDLLVTWDNGEKGKLSSHAKVFRPGDITDEEITEIVALELSIYNAEARLEELRQKGVKGSEVLTAAIGEDLFDYGRHREPVAG